ncbi:MAG: plasmid pRiA4b ORF-3 family protein [Patescibacteria group bacterium]
MPKKANSAYQLQIIIQDSRPPIWRRVLVPVGFTFHDLHLAIQSAFDWENHHLYSFEIQNNSKLPARNFGANIADLSIEENNELGEINSRTEKISSHLQKIGDKITYTYDFGDNWDHKIVLEKIVENYDWTYPQCIKAVGHAPCEDSGAIWGWEEKIEMLKKYNPKDEEQRELYEWLCETVPAIDDLEDPRNFDPKKVDLDLINERLEDYKGMENAFS